MSVYHLHHIVIRIPQYMKLGILLLSFVTDKLSFLHMQQNASKHFMKSLLPQPIQNCEILEVFLKFDLTWLVKQIRPIKQIRKGSQMLWLKYEMSYSLSPLGYDISYLSDLSPLIMKFPCDLSYNFQTISSGQNVPKIPQMGFQKNRSMGT